MPIRILKSGKSGTGKSCCAGTAAMWGKVEYHDLECNAEYHVKTFLKNTGKEALVSNIDVVSYKGLSDRECYIQCFNRLKECIKAAKNGEELPFVTMVIDNLTILESGIREIIEEVSDGGGIRKRSVIEMALLDESLISFGTNDYDNKNKMVAVFLSLVKRAPFNVIVTAHVREPEDESQLSKIENRKTGQKAGIDKVSLIFSGKYKDSIPSYFNEWHQHFVDAYGKFRYQAKPSLKRPAKSALGPKDVNSDGTAKVWDLGPFTEFAAKERK